MTTFSLYPADAHACGNLRLAWPGEVLYGSGYDVIVNPFKKKHPIPIDVKAVSDMFGNAVITDIAPVAADVCVFQRPATKNMLEMMSRIKGQGVKIVVDVDDALWAIHPKNVSYQSYNGRGKAHWRWLVQALTLADLVTVTTEPLAVEVRHKWNPNVEVIPNFIPEYARTVGYDKLSNEPSPIINIGWAATSLTHPNDPSVTRDDVAEVIRSDTNGQTRFLSVGGQLTREPAMFGFTTDDSYLISATGPINIGKWYEAVAQLDISLVPLEDTPFNRAKSHLKMLESAAVGCAVLASPTPDNLHLHEWAGIGTIAKERRWGRKLRQMLNSDLRIQQERDWEATARFTIEGNAHLWVDVWTKGLGL